jgi:flagellar basal body P-ring protein FlgI
MENQNTAKKLFFSVFLIFAILLCIPQSESLAKKKAPKAEPVPEKPQLDKTIGELAEFMAFSPIPVKGIGLVVGLSNTGSSECPPQIRDYLRQYILTQLGPRDIASADLMISSLDTAVVVVEGDIPPGASKHQAFDVTVRSLPGTQTTSLLNGRLYTTELKFVAQVEEAVRSTKTLAIAAGPVYIDKVSDPNIDARKGIVLGGGRVMENYQFTLSILKPDFEIAAAIRNHINQRFGKDTASAVSPEIIYLSIPNNYKDKKERFIELVKSLYITDTAVNEEKHIDWLVENLNTASDKTKFQTGLEAIGKNAADKIRPLLDSKDESTRFAAAKCLFVIGDDAALKPLRELAQDKSSSFRIAAIQTISDYGDKSDVISLMSRLVRDDNFEVRYNAYKSLLKHGDTSVIHSLVADDFYIDQVIQTGPKTIYASRTGQAGIVLLGAPISCRKNIYVESDGGQIIINSTPDGNGLSIMRKHPITKELMGPFKCSLRVADLIRDLGEVTTRDAKDRKLIGLGVSYSDIVALLKKMVDKGAIKADFVAGPVSPAAPK